MLMITSEDVQRIFPKAVQWVTQIEQACMEIGHQLSPQSKRDARAIGVQQIDLVRVMVLNETPLPTDRDLRKFILQTAICSKKGIAFGHGISRNWRLLSPADRSQTRSRNAI